MCSVLWCACMCACTAVGAGCVVCCGVRVCVHVLL